MLDFTEPAREYEARPPYSPGTALWLTGAGWVRLTGSGRNGDGTAWISGRVQPGQPWAGWPVLFCDVDLEAPQ